MKKKQIVINVIIAMTISFVTNCYGQIKDLDQFFKDEYPKYNLLYYQKGDFTHLGNEEYVVFYEDPSSRYEKEKPPSINKVVVFSLTNRLFLNKYELINVRSLGYDDFETKLIRGLKVDRQEWNGFCYVGDFNDNSFDEIIFFGVYGSTFIVNIYEFQNKNFEQVLKYPGESPLSNAETREDDKRKLFIIYDSGGPDLPRGKRNWYRMSWNEKSNKYEIAEKGIQDWYDPVTGKIINE